MFQIPLHPVISDGFDKDADCNDDVCIIVKSLDVPVTPVLYIYIYPYNLLLNCINACKYIWHTQMYLYAYMLTSIYMKQ